MWLYSNKVCVLRYGDCTLHGQKDDVDNVLTLKIKLKFVFPGISPWNWIRQDIKSLGQGTSAVLLIQKSSVKMRLLTV